MARLQILDLPEGADDSRPPFVLVVDQAMPRRVVMGEGQTQFTSEWERLAEQIGAQGVIVTAETVEIPANEAIREEAAAAFDKVIEDARRGEPDGGHRFVAVPAHDGSLRCSVCGITRIEWQTRRNVPTCNEVRAAKGGA